MTGRGQNIMLGSTFDILQQEVADIKRRLTNDIPEALRQAYETGGQWHDNPHWDHTLEDQKRLSAKLSKLMDSLQDPIFIEDLLPNCEKVTVGTEVETKNYAEGEKLEIFKIVGPLDVIYNPRCKGGKFVSFQSPVGRALLQRRRNDVITIELPGQQNKLLIIQDVRRMHLGEKPEKGDGNE